MAVTAPYKQRNRKDRRAVLETDFSKGMMASNSLVDEGYVKTLVNFAFEKETGALIPRPALRPCQIIFPNMNNAPETGSILLDDRLTIKDVKVCVEDNKSYQQFILGLTDPVNKNRGKIIAVTSEKSGLSCNIPISDDYAFDLDISDSRYSEEASATFYTPDLQSIHNVPLSDDESRQIEFPVGSFAFGNSYYFFNSTDSKLYRTYFDKTSIISPYYEIEALEPKEPSVSEAVTYGYNMLRGSAAYTFSNQHASPVFQFEGILPYDASGSTLLMTPKKNQPVLFRAYYNVLNGKKYDIVWEWRETTSADWTPLQTDSGVVFSDSTVLEAYFQPPAKDMMIRVSAYPYTDLQGNPTTEPSDTVEKAMVVGFDFSVETYGAASTLDQKVYDLSTATGMEAWNGRLVLWGVPEDPTILFLSDYNDPSYFPYPNNIIVFDEPIIYAVEFMDTLAVFTSDKIYQVTRSDDGNSWVSTVIQSHLYIDVWDKHLIQTVRNMLYFKSGNYYYMMVPKARSTTGELTLAPITSPITSFFDNFSVNVQNVIEETYGYTGLLELITYYNFLDYEDIHNLYIYKTDSDTSVLHFDMIYNTVDRTWKIWIFEALQPVFPARHNATETGRVATTGILDARSREDLGTPDYRRFIQIMLWDKLSVKEGYVPDDTTILYDPDHSAADYTGTTVSMSGGTATILEPSTVVCSDEYADIVGTAIVFLGASDYYFGFSSKDLANVLRLIYRNLNHYFMFQNDQLLDTGYIRDKYQAKKRYRELQLELSNLDKTSMNFGMEFVLDNSPRKILYKYDTTQAIDEFDPEYGVVYIDSTPFFEVDLNDIDLTNQWVIDQSLAPDVKLWKVRVAISGKGSAPRLRLFSRNGKRFELTGINWVSRIMHMR